MMKKIFAALFFVFMFALCAVPALADTDARLKASYWSKYTVSPDYLIPGKTGKNYDDYYHQNCKMFANLVMKKLYKVDLPSLENSSSRKNVRLASGPVVDSFYNVNGTLTLEKVRTALNTAKVGYVIQMYWDMGSYGGKVQHTMIVSTTYDNQDKIEFLTANWAGTINNYTPSSYERFRETIADAGIDGGFTIYRFIGDTTPTPLQEGDVEINKENFPDENFRNIVLQYCDENKDGIMSKAELSEIDGLDIQGQEIADLKGIEYFTALKKLDCSSNGLTTLDVSKNTALTELFCQVNQLTTLKLGKNMALTYLQCSNNNQLTTLDLSECKALTQLDCNNNDKLILLDVHGVMTLTQLYSIYNQKLTTLNVSGCRALRALQCYNNRLIMLDVGGCTALEYLECNINQLTTLDVSGCTALRWLYCNENQLTTLDVSKNTALENLCCESNQLKTIKLGNLPNLSSLECRENQLTEIDASGCSYLYDYLIYCDDGVKIIRDGSSSNTGGGENNEDTTKPVKPKITTKFKTTYIVKDEPCILFSLEATGTTPMTWEAENLPSGMFIYDERITGAPKETGKFKVRISVTNASNKTAKKSFTLYVVDPVEITTDDALPEGTFKKSYSFKMAAEGGKKVTWSASGLPQGMKISKTSGKISGKPKETGTFFVSITATSKKIAQEFPGSSDTVDFRLKVNE